MSDRERIEILRVGSGAPELWVVAGVHGDEVEGVACVEDALALLRPDGGTLVGVPVAHPAALALGTRHGPDGADLNRTYPGRIDGGPTERVAHALWEKLAPSASALVTIHSWGRHGCTVPYVEYARDDTRGRDLAHRLGLPFAEPWDWPDGLLPKVAVAAGIPAVELELGGLGRQTPEALELGLDAIRAAAEWLGLGRFPRPGSARTVRRHLLRTVTGGRVRQLRRIGEPVAAGDAVCQLRRGAASVVETLTSPVDGWIAVHASYGEIAEGGEAAHVFEEA